MGNFKSKEKVALLPQDGHCTFEFIRAKDVPKADFDSESDCFIVAWLAVYSEPKVKHDGSSKAKRAVRISEKMTTPTCDSNKNPIWTSYKDFLVKAPSNAFLVAQIWDEDKLSSPDLIGTVHFPLTDFIGDTRTVTKLVAPKDFHIGSKGENPNFSLTVRHVEQPADGNIQYKTIFCVRHGQSEWNLGKKNGDLTRVMKYDHPLTELGCTQASEVNAKWKACRDDPKYKSVTAQKQGFSLFGGWSRKNKDADDTSGVSPTSLGRPTKMEKLSPSEMAARNEEYVRRFLESKCILSSPLTRALQTCLLVLEDHDGMTSHEKGVRLYRNIREVKNVGGQDTVGEKCGAEILPNARDKLSAVLGAKRAKKVTNVDVDINDTDQKWWVSATTYESDSDVKKRIAEVMQYLKFGCDDNVICVGHSALFKKLCSKNLADGMAKTRPELYQKLSKYKLFNGAVLALTIDFRAPEGPNIVDADLLFDSKFVEKKSTKPKKSDNGNVDSDEDE